ncbi:MAG TPA: threonine/serine exporter family protein [Kofleriaceae bacterium]|nr:threonine/serine exporter family protein [Kofleriaceae bacterium]
MTAPDGQGKPDEAAVGFVMALGRALHRYGTPAHRLEDSLVKVCAGLGIAAEVFTSPTALIMSFGRPTDLRSRMLRVDASVLDMGKLAEVDGVADDVIAHEITPEEGERRLEQIIAGKRRYGHGLSTLVHGVTAGALAVFFHGGLYDVAAAAGIGLTLGLLAQLLQRSTDQARVFELVGSAFAAFAANVFSSVTPHITASLVTLAALVVLLPGMSLTVAMTELATRHLIAGTARLMSAVIVLLELVVGVALGDRAAQALVHVHQATPVALPEYANWIALAASSVALAVLVQAQVRAFGWIVAGCVVAYVGSRFGAVWLGDNQLGVLIGAFALGLLANIYARYLDRPSQVVSVPAMLVLVPGGMGFRGMASLLNQDTLTGVETLFAMFIVAIAIVAGLLIANALVSPRRSL